MMKIMLIAISVYLLIGIVITTGMLLYDKFSTGAILTGKYLNDTYYKSKIIKRVGYTLLIVVVTPIAFVVTVSQNIKGILEKK